MDIRIEYKDGSEESIEGVTAVYVGKTKIVSIVESVDADNRKERSFASCDKTCGIDALIPEAIFGSVDQYLPHGQGKSRGGNR